MFNTVEKLENRQAKKRGRNELVKQNDMVKEDKYLVAMFSDGSFLALEENHSTTTPFHVSNPADAKKIRPYTGDEDDFFTNIKTPEYYFKNIYRMRVWLKGTKMVIVKAKIITEVVEI